MPQRQPLRISSHLLTTITAALILLSGGVVFSEDRPAATETLDGTWRLVAYETTAGKRLSQTENLWVFSGSRLYRKSKVVENVYEIQIDPESSPKLIEMTYRERDVPRHVLPPEFVIYKFVDDKLVIATSRVSGKRPDSFIPASINESSVVDFVWTLEKIDKAANIPERMLKNFDEPVTRRTQNQEAEAVLLKFVAGMFRRESLASMQPLVAYDKADQLLKEAAKLPPVVVKDLDRVLSTMTARDATRGERLTLSNGESIVVEDEHFDSNKVLLVLQERGVDQECFWLHRINAQWKVDATDLIIKMRSKHLGLPQGVFIGMNPDRVRERLAKYKESRLLQSYSVIESNDSELTVDWKESGKIIRHTFSFAGGELIDYNTSKSPEQK